MISDYQKYKEKYSKLKKEKYFLEIECDIKEDKINKLKKEIAKLEKENYQYKLLLIEKIKEELK